MLDTKKENTFLIPFIIGAIGHLDIRPEDVSIIETKLREVFQEIKRKYPHTPLLVLSPLAEGADRLIARIGIEEGAKLGVVLPFDKEEYKKDFATPASKKEFEELLKKAEWCETLPFVKGNNENTISKHGKERDIQYEQAGIYIAQYSQILIALWDGVETHLVGGTSEIINYKLGKNKRISETNEKMDYKFHTLDEGLVYHILIPRKKNLAPKGKMFSLKVLYPIKKGNDLKTYQNTLTKFAEFSLRYEKYKDTEKVKKSKEYFISEEVRKKLPETFLDIENLYAVADTFAIKFQRLMNVYVHLLVISFFFGTVLLFFINHYYHQDVKLKDFLKWSEEVTSSEHIFKHISKYVSKYPHLKNILDNINLKFNYSQSIMHNKRFVKSIAIKVLILLFLANYVFYRFRGKYQSKFLDYRALAEGLRVYYFWELLDIKDDVTNYYLRQQKKDMDWIRQVIRVADFLKDKNKLIEKCTLSDSELCFLVKNNWIESQRNYYDNTTLKNRKNMDILVHISNYVILFIIILMIFFWERRIFNASGKPAEYINLLNDITFTIFIIVLAMIAWYNDTKSFFKQAGRFFRMGCNTTMMLNDLDNHLKADDIPAAKKVIRKFGREALLENGEWVLTNADYPMISPRQ